MRPYDNAKKSKLSDIFGDRRDFAADFDAAEAAPEYTPVEADEYIADLVDGGLAQHPRTKTPSYKTVFEIAEGPHKGRRLYKDYYLSGPALPYSKAGLAKICVKTAAELEAAPEVVRCRLNVSLRESDSGTEYNEVDKVTVLGPVDASLNPFPPKRDEDESKRSIAKKGGKTKKPASAEEKKAKDDAADESGES
ncbi:hypothetical protein [Alienimonas californiensis]|uniref:Uncharacterized protein n=1 Tax=Alienimonas californiensis TaxID=2527989 RepID=A0A517P5H4_9PLAN|nr:hypothetical protein [Alienimonas californiensis]QDT14606.1 hypothetical protein CA12_06820 [Alienimonas californiensis]